MFSSCSKPQLLLKPFRIACCSAVAAVSDIVKHHVLSFVLSSHGVLSEICPFACVKASALVANHPEEVVPDAAVPKQQTPAATASAPEPQQ
jgi:hypothetical protein